ncbi:motility protein A [Desulfoluna spongiiphila]|uniref:Chemotaxis protein MotA n=1 Tax=Desulfoluna spongiiphila TaxID=419481 RepID=A0A1G5BXC6_9BACT|nr:MotA/TolQ/ExbB proton channel family protein [Desulfoluna spongiiphila]SCX94694.1 chemotaxis protein MotA [Desulfoluna spongiiphila]VVS93963.1 mota/tolq/exbb proton channel [Desulfoluna spongiiphila]
MDLASLIGVISGVGFTAACILLGSSLMLFWNMPSVMIVVGGTIASTLIAYPLKEFLGVFKTVGKVFMFKIEKPEDLVKALVEISNKARKGGLLSIEADINSTEDPYLKSALQMTVDGVKTSDIAAVMQKRMELTHREHKVGYSVLASMGSYAPAFGMVGTLIGLVQMLANLDDPSSIGPKMAVAMITTFYGALMANLFFIPMSDKLKLRSEEEIMNMTLLYEGVVSIREGEHPRLMEDKLNVYLSAGGGKAAKEE